MSQARPNPPATMSAELVRDHWTPRDVKGTRDGLAGCRTGACVYLAELQRSTQREERAPAVAADAASPLPDVLRDLAPPIDASRPFLVVWYRPGCQVCENEAHQGVVRALERYGREVARPPFSVHRVWATESRLEKFPHVRAVPMYDLVVPEAGATSPYGPGLRLTTMHNERGRLLSEFPGVTLPVAPGAPSS